MAHWLLSVDGRHVRVRTRPGEPGTYDLEWDAAGRRQQLTARRSDRSPLSDAELQEAVRRAFAPVDGRTPATASRATGVVREWHREEGWGVIDSDETPGGCWTHFSAVRVTGYAALEPGQDVDLEWERADQDGYDYRAVAAWPAGQDRVEPVLDADSDAVSRSLTITFDAPPADG